MAKTVRLKEPPAGLRYQENFLARRCAYLLGGSIRSSWQHSIPPTKSLRYSITFRTLRNPERWLGAALGASA